MKTSTIDTRLGTVTGITQKHNHGEVNGFFGLRYGEAPIGKRRFLPAVMASGWSGTFDATRYPNRAMQANTTGSLGQNISGELNEDCLFLNIATPHSALPNKSENKKPVLVWIHGGGFSSGSANEYDGSVLAGQGDVVVVTINYRLGSFGFLNLAALGDEFAGSASNGIGDQILALRWVREHIGDYGGDANNVTLFGESAGGDAIFALLGAPAAVDLFHKAVVHSAKRVYELAPDPTPQIATKLGVKPQQLLSVLRGMSAEELQQSNLGGPHNGGACVDGTIVTHSPFAALDERGAAMVPLIIGTNRDEASLFTRKGDAKTSEHYDAVNQIFAGDLIGMTNPDAYLNDMAKVYPDDGALQLHERVFTDLFRVASVNLAEKAAAENAKVWLYRFDLPANKSGEEHLGATHASEMAFTFNTFANPDSVGYSFHDAKDPVVLRIGEQWSNTILALAKTGSPNGAGMPEWPLYNNVDRPCLIIDETSRIESDVDALNRSLWTF